MSVEELISRSLRAALADRPRDACVPESEEFRSFLSGLDYFIPQIIGEIHPEMLGQSGDGLLPIVARKTGKDEVELLGHFCFIADQRLTPIHLKLQLDPARDSVAWLECRLGERGDHGMVRTPYGSPGKSAKLLHALVERASSLDWFYQVTFGERRS